MDQSGSPFGGLLHILVGQMVCEATVKGRNGMGIQSGKQERVDFIPGTDLHVVQSDALFPFSIDSVLLARFVNVPIQQGHLVDLCTGNGVIPFILSSRSKGEIVGVEIQQEVCALAERGRHLNHLEAQLRIICGDAKALPEQIGPHQWDVVTCNPPYFSRETSRDQKLNPHLAIARHELLICLHEVIDTAARLLRQNGKLALVHRPQRLVEILSEMRRAGIEPKRLRFVHPRPEKAANMVLVEGAKLGKPGLNVLPPLFVHQADGSYSAEVWGTA